MFKSIALVLTLATTSFAASPFGSPFDTGVDFVEQMSALTSGRTGSPQKLKKGDAATTKAKFKPPVEILIEAKTGTTNLRMSYAADQVIFNWERARTQLRIDGGPADGKHKMGAGQIQPNKYVIIRWVVTPRSQSIFVDDELRFEHSGDYSRIDNPISVFCAEGSEISLKSIKVRPLSSDVLPGSNKPKKPLPVDPPTEESLTTYLVGTTWTWFGNETLTFLADGKAVWKENREPWPWKVSNAAQREITSVNKSRNRTFTITFDGNMKEGIIKGDDATRKSERLSP